MRRSAPVRFCNRIRSWWSRIQRPIPGSPPIRWSPAIRRSVFMPAHRSVPRMASRWEHFASSTTSRASSTMPGAGSFSTLAASTGSMLALHRRNLALSVASGCDPLTGLSNRRVFDKALVIACAGAARGVQFGLLALDLDHFKTVNDELGHGVGDLLPREVARRPDADGPCIRHGRQTGRERVRHYTMIV